jgi:hypothetical protein
MNPDPKFQDKRRYVRLEYGGSVCIVEPDDVESMTEDHDPDDEPIKVSDVWMTLHEYENLPEFEGF